jgi:hypothetical protein
MLFNINHAICFVHFLRVRLGLLGLSSPLPNIPTPNPIARLGPAPDPCMSQRPRGGGAISLLGAVGVTFAEPLPAEVDDVDCEGKPDVGVDAEANIGTVAEGEDADADEKTGVGLGKRTVDSAAGPKADNEPDEPSPNTPNDVAVELEGPNIKLLVVPALAPGEGLATT